MRRRFIGYPVDRVMAVIDDPLDAAAAARALAIAGVPTRDITLLRGDEGADRLDGTGAQHGIVARVRRSISFMAMDQLPDMAWYEGAVRAGAVVVMVRVRGDVPKADAVDILRRHGAHFVNHYGRFATEELDRWRGPEPTLPGILKR